MSNEIVPIGNNDSIIPRQADNDEQVIALSVTEIVMTEMATAAVLQL